MRHHILIPTDFSENAWSAAIYAIKLYAKEPCTFYFSHAWSYISGSRTYVSPTYIDTLQERSKEQLAELKNRALAESTNKDHNFATIFSLDSLIDSIKMAVQKFEVNLVVMGTKGATGAKEFLFGSNTVSVMQKVRQCPLLLIPKNHEFEIPAQLAFPTDFTRSYGEDLKPIQNLAELYNSKINILHIIGKQQLSDIQNSNLETLKINLKDYRHSFNWIPEEGRKQHSISGFIEEKKVNILTMIDYEHNIIENIIKEPVIKKIGYHSIIPFLVVPHIDR